MNSDYTMGTIVRVLMKAGIVQAKTFAGGKVTVHSWIKNNKLRFRQIPHNRRYVANDEELKEVIKAFSVGGKGYWFAKQ